MAAFMAEATGESEAPMQTEQALEQTGKKRKNASNRDKKRDSILFIKVQIS